MIYGVEAPTLSGLQEDLFGQDSDDLEQLDDYHDENQPGTSLFSVSLPESDMDHRNSRSLSSLSESHMSY